MKKIWFISIQNIHEDNNIKKYSKEIKPFGILGIINIIKDNLSNELEDLKKIDIIANMHNLTFLITLSTHTNGIKNIIIELAYNLLNELLSYLKEEGKESSISLSSQRK